MSEARRSLCGERTQLRPCFWARGVWLCEACFEAADRAGLVPWFKGEAEGS
jgi:hypothetical protein